MFDHRRGGGEQRRKRRKIFGLIRYRPIGQGNDESVWSEVEQDVHCTCYMLELVGKCNIARTENRHFQQKFDRMSTHYYATGLYLQSMNSLSHFLCPVTRHYWVVCVFQMDDRGGIVRVKDTFSVDQTRPPYRKGIPQRIRNLSSRQTR